MLLSLGVLGTPGSAPWMESCIQREVEKPEQSSVPGVVVLNCCTSTACPPWDKWLPLGQKGHKSGESGGWQGLQGACTPHGEG